MERPGPLDSKLKKENKVMFIFPTKNLLKDLFKTIPQSKYF